MALSHLSYFLLLLLPFSLFSAPQDFRSCQLKYQVSSVNTSHTKAFSISKDYVIFYSADEPQVKILKRDPFLGLNLVRSERAFKHIFTFYNHHPKQLAAVLPAKVVEGRLQSRQIGLNRLARFSTAAPKNSLITGTCCGIIGLSTGNGVIEKEYIQHFLESEQIEYGDVGIRLADDKGVRVAEVNPFFEGSAFLLDDVIISMDGKKVNNAAELSRKILFSKPQSQHLFTFLRAKEKRKITVIVKQRLSGGLIPDSFFDLFGLELDENLIIKEDNAKYEIKKEDRLLSIMGKEVKSLGEVRHVLSQEKTSENKMIMLLLRRNGFDFFIHFAKP